MRCLLLSGANPDIHNQEGSTPEILAIAQGNNDIADLLSRMRTDKREVCVRQLLPGTQPLNRVKVKIFGGSGAGKSTLIDSLKCGYFGSFFRKSRMMSQSEQQTIRKRAHAVKSRHIALVCVDIVFVVFRIGK